MSDTIVDIPEELFDSQVGLSFSGTMDLPELTSGPDVYTFDAPLSWQVLVVNSGDRRFLVTGTVVGEAQATCGRCLGTFDLPLNGEIEGFWLMEDPGEDIPEDLAEDEFEVIGEDRKMDLSSFIQAAIVLALPFVPLCREDCKGLCPRCGKNLNEGPCDCEQLDSADDGINPDNPFAVLKDLQFPDEN
ncbi:MAG: YceD family protein [Eggerthellaceae bacterium]|jgi:uncharacterized protein